MAGIARILKIARYAQRMSHPFPTTEASSLCFLYCVLKEEGNRGLASHFHVFMRVWGKRCILPEESSGKRRGSEPLLDPQQMLNTKCPKQKHKQLLKHACNHNSVI